MKSDRLFFREWFVVFCVVLSALFLVFSQDLSVFSSGVAKNESFSKMNNRKKIQVTVDGAVEYPGVYRVSPGVSIGSVLELAGFTSRSDRAALYLKKTLLSSCELHVPEKISKKEKKKKQD